MGYSWFHPNMTMLNTFLAKKKLGGRQILPAAMALNEHYEGSKQVKNRNKMITILCSKLTVLIHHLGVFALKIR